VAGQGCHTPQKVVTDESGAMVGFLLWTIDHNRDLLSVQDVLSCF